MATRVFWIAAAAVLFSTAASADQFAALYGNTMTTVAPDGSKVIMYVNQDGTWERRAPGGAIIKGRYEWKDPDTACFTITDPAPQQGEQATACRAYKGTHNVGESWTDVDVKGNVYTSTITAGR
jgi:hypothetical protein